MGVNLKCCVGGDEGIAAFLLELKMRKGKQSLPTFLVCFQLSESFALRYFLIDIKCCSY